MRSAPFPPPQLSYCFTLVVGTLPNDVICSYGHCGQSAGDIRPHLTKTLNDNHFLLLLRDAGDTELYERRKSGSRWRSALAMFFIEQPALQRCYGQFFVLVVAPALARPDWTIWTPVAAAGAIAIWGIGRAARHLLSGH